MAIVAKIQYTIPGTNKSKRLESYLDINRRCNSNNNY